MTPLSREARRVGLRAEGAVRVGVGERAEEPLEPAGAHQHELASFARPHAALRVGHAARREDHPSGPDAVLLVPHPEDVLALEHVEELVLVLVDVEGRVDEGRHLLEQGERATGRLGRDAEQDRHVAEDEALALVCRHREGHARHDPSLARAQSPVPAVP